MLKVEGQYKEATVLLKRTEAERVIIRPCPEEHLGPEDTEEKRSFEWLGVKFLHLYRNHRLRGQVGLMAG